MPWYSNLFSGTTVNRATLPMRTEAARGLTGLVMAPFRALNETIQGSLGNERRADGVQPRPGPYSAREINAITNRPGGYGERLPPGEQPMLTAQQVAIQVRNGKLSDHEAQKMINEGKVRLPDIRTVGTQEPAPVEDRSIRVGGAAPSTPAAAQPAQVETFPVTPQGAIETRPLDDAPKASKVEGLAKEKFGEVSANPPAKQFVEGQQVAGAGLQQANALDALANGNDKGRFDQSVYARAQAQVAKLGEPGGMS